MSFWTEVYEQGDWQKSWTIFYWGWWIAWSPFVGMFIARISRGRTIREFLLSVLLIPCLLTFIWLTIFGNTAIYQDMILKYGIADAVNNNIAVALFVMLNNLPLSIITSIFGVFLIVTFFVTSSDSASLVIDTLASGGMEDPPIIQRVFWAILEGLVAALLLYFGGLKALQTASITTALPFCFILILMCFCLFKELKKEKA